MFSARLSFKALELGRPKWNYKWLSQVSASTSRLQVLDKGGVRHITLADPKTRNSLSLKMVQELHAAVTREDPALRCIILGAQGKVFSAGHNLKELTLKEGRDYHQKVFDACTELMLTLQNIPVPVVAKVNGIAAAAGCQLVASCDIVIATHNSSFSTPGGSVGIFCSTPGIPLVRSVPRKVSAHMLLTGLPITAEEALRAGLVSKLVSENELETETLRTVEAITHKSKAVIALGKKFMYKQMEMGIEEAYSEGSCLMVNNVNMKDGQEGIGSFIEKRKPSWFHSDE
ncbi:enoyl-CoA hydratase domain-containing protein 3, mitochondrial isoform X2 [Procambarus clarkii]|uniref:enoyl-CoA hydratase domain-containing protein 3, mitochondrial isoform X2 n=1 Tax=Procambarus clarkii TaxID=6728 RepID=UPI001E671230|nr:enoyl-CoA hydratase domain-containing protein 3, mitochondrial-like [Procambarus clarkii]